MTNTGLSKIAFNILDRVTDIYPSFGSKIFQKIFLFIFGSERHYKFILRKYQKKLLLTKDFNKILIVVDVNIGDSINSQSCIEVLREYFSNSQIDYVCNKTGGEILSGSPLVNNVYKIYKNSGLPLSEDVNKINQIVKEGNYSLILNMSPFLGKNNLVSRANVIHLYIAIAFYVVYLSKRISVSSNLSLATYNFFKDFLSPLQGSKNFIKKEINLKSNYEGNKVYLAEKDLIYIKAFLINNNIFQKGHLILFNLSVTVKFSMIPIDIQLKILEDAVLSDYISTVLIYKGNSTIDIDKMILERIPEKYIEKIIIVPNSFSISEFTALIDFCDMFVSGDTGTVHIAASKKILIDSDNSLRNKTALVSIFGASDSRIYNYDSKKSGHSPANQNAPSQVFIGEALCRNFTCINRLVKTCKEIRCFLGLNAEEISSYIISYFKNLKETEIPMEESIVYNNGSYFNNLEETEYSTEKIMVYNNDTYNNT